MPGLPELEKRVTKLEEDVKALAQSEHALCTGVRTEMTLHGEYAASELCKRCCDILDKAKL